MARTQCLGTLFQVMMEVINEISPKWLFKALYDSITKDPYGEQPVHDLPLAQIWQKCNV